MQIPGTLLSPQEASAYSNRLSYILKSNPGKFPGAQPISFEEKHSQVLLEKNYFVSEKADGIRLLLFSCLVNVALHGPPKFAPQTLLIDRKNDYYKINGFGFPQNSSSFLTDTVVDGELIYDKTSEGKQILYFLAFDALMVDGKSLVDKPYTSRLGYLRELVLKPYLAKVQKEPSWRRSHPFEIRQKKVEPSYHLDRVFKQIQEYKHESDGLIFTSADAGYHFGTCETMVKWKPPSENTVDFLLNVNKTPEGDKYSILIFYGVRGHQIESDFVFGSDLEKVKGEKLHARIIECKYDPNWPHNWRFSRFRDDKADANHISTFIKVQKSIHDNVTKEKLLGIRDDIENAWKEREAAKKGVKRLSDATLAQKKSKQKISSYIQETIQQGNSSPQQKNQEVHDFNQDYKSTKFDHEQKDIVDSHEVKQTNISPEKGENISEPTISEKELLSVDFD